MTGRRRTALITGASSGIGEAFASVFGSHGFDLVITARREDRLRALAARLTEEHSIRVDVIRSDLAEPGAASTLAAEIQKRELVVDALVNNAGFGVPGSYTSPDWTVHEQMLRVMVVAVSELTYCLLPGMIDRRYGRIVNVASVAGLVPSGAGTLYGAAKAFVVNLSVSLSHEVRKHGIYVTVLCPGLTATEFHSRPVSGDTVKSLPRWMWMDARTVAQQGFSAVMAGTPVCVNGAANKLLVALLRYVPRPLVVGLGRQVARVRRLR